MSIYQKLVITYSIYQLIKLAQDQAAYADLFINLSPVLSELREFMLSNIDLFPTYMQDKVKRDCHTWSGSE